MKARLANRCALVAAAVLLASGSLVVGCGAPGDEGIAIESATASLSDRLTAAGCDGHRADLLDRFYKHFARGQARAVADMLPRDATWHQIGWREDVVPFAGTYVGRKALQHFFSAYFAAVDVEDFAVEYTLASGDYVNVHLRLVGRVRPTHQTFDAEFVHVWHFDSSGKPLFIRSYYETSLQVDAFTPGRGASLADLKDPDDTFEVLPTSYDVEGMVRTLYDNFYVGNFPVALAMAAPDVAIYFKGKGFPFAGEYHGLDGAMQFIYNLAGTAVPYQIDRFQVTQGDRTDVVLFENWHVPSTGKDFHVHTVNSWRVNADGKLMGFINYPDGDVMIDAYTPAE